MSETVISVINPRLINAFVESIRNVFSTMVGLETKVGEAVLKTSVPTPLYDVSGIVGFSGEVSGSVAISFKRDVAQAIIETFCGEMFDIDSDDFADAVGELANMVAGNAKKDFGLDANISIPSVIIGPGHSVARLSDVPCLILPCQTDAGEYSVEINIKEVASVL